MCQRDNHQDRYRKHYRGAKVDRVVIIGATMGQLACLVAKQPKVSEGQRVNCCHEVNLVEVATPEGPMMFNLIQGFDVNSVVQDRRIKINYLSPVEEGDDVARPQQSASEMLFEMYRDR